MHDDCKLRFLELKAKRAHRFVVFKIEEKQKQVVVEKVGEPADIMMNSPQVFLLTNVVMPCTTLILLLPRTVRKARYSSLPGKFALAINKIALLTCNMVVIIWFLL